MSGPPGLPGLPWDQARRGQARLHRNGRDAGPVLALTGAAWWTPDGSSLAGCWFAALWWAAQWKAAAFSVAHW